MRAIALAMLVVLAVHVPAGKAGVRFDFEQPFYIEELPNICKDHAVVRHQGLYHVFYIHSLPQPDGWQLRYEGWLGHLTSPDLKHWTRQDSILPVSDVPDSWEDGFIWAPKVISSPYGLGWWMFYTGVSYPEIAQQTGRATSTDLYHWKRAPGNPVYHPGSWADWDSSRWSNCRDPELYQEDGTWYLLNTCSAADLHGAISMATSTNLITWQDEGPLMLNESYQVLESPQLVKAGDFYHLFYTEQNVGFTSHLASPLLTGGWHVDERVFIDAGAAPEISDFGDEILFSRHMGTLSTQGNAYCYRFDEIRFDDGDQMPDIISRAGLGQDWTVIFGDAFNRQPTFLDNPLERGEESSNMEGNSYLATNERHQHPQDGMPGTESGPGSVGLMRTASFTLSENRMKLLVGGGDDAQELFVIMVRSSDSRILFWETGEGGHAMSRRIWDTSSLAGQEVFLAVADLASTGEGWISVDSIEEYEETGEDEFPPELPLVNGPHLDELIDVSGVEESGGESQATALPGRLLNPHPNPFNPRTHLRYELETPGHVELEIVDPSGRRVLLIDGGESAPGPGYFVWKGVDDAGRPCASGVYLATLRLDGRRLDSRRLVLTR